MGLDVIRTGFRRVALLEIFFQNHSGRDCVYRGYGRAALTFAWCFRVAENPSRLLFEQALRFPAGQALVEHIHRQVQLFAESGGEAGGFFRHFAVGAIEAKRKANDDLADAMFASEFAQASHIFIAIDALESEERPRELRLRFGDSQANARAPVVNGQNRSRLVSGLVCGRLVGHFLYGLRPRVPFCQGSQ